MGEVIRSDQLHVLLVRQDDIAKELQGELAELDRLRSHLPQLSLQVFRDVLGHASGKPEYGMDDLAADGGDDLLTQAPAHRDHLLTDLHADLADDAQHVALGGRSRGSNDEIGTT